jgi:hypothetical protein
VTASTGGETARLAFDGAADQRVSLKLSDVTIGTSGCCSTKVSILNPDGSLLAIPTYVGTSGGFLDTKTLPVDGRYTIEVDPQSATGGSVTATLYDVPADAGGAIEPGGAPVTVTTTVPGQNAALFFPGSAGRRVSLKLTSVTIGSSCCSSAKVSILRPDGVALAVPAAFGTNGGFLDTRTLPSDGIYTVLLDPQAAATGDAIVTLYDVPPDVAAPIVPAGAPVNVSTTVPGQNVRIGFDGVAGQRVSLKLTGVSFGTSCCSGATVSILRPEGSTLVAPALFGTNGGFLDTKTLPITGSYTVVLDPQSNATGSATATLYDVPADITGSLTVGGAAQTVALNVPGQNARLTFSGTAGQRVTLRLTGVTIGPSCCTSSQVSVVNPSGNTLLSPTFFGTSGKSVALQPALSGTYTIVLDPQSNAVGSLTVGLTSP